MSTLKPTKKVSRRHELREDTVVTFYARVTEYVAEHRSLMLGIGGAVLAGVLLLVGLSFWRANQQRQAIDAMGFAVRAYENGEYRTALDGESASDIVGLLAVADRYGSTDAGNLARFYSADALFRLGLYEESLEHFRDFDKSDDFLGAAAYAGEAAILEIEGDHGTAAERYLRAARAYENEVSSPDYLTKAARAFENAGNYAAALSAYAEVQDEYPDSQFARDNEASIARATVLSDAN